MSSSLSISINIKKKRMKFYWLNEVNVYNPKENDIVLYIVNYLIDGLEYTIFK